MKIKNLKLRKNSRQNNKWGSALFLNGAIVVAFVTSIAYAFTYLVGIACFQIYMSGLGLPYAFFKKSTEEYFTYAYLAFKCIFNAVSSEMSKNAVIFILIVAIILIFRASKPLSEQLNKSEKIRKIGRSIRSNKFMKLAGYMTIFPSIWVTLVYYVVFLFTVIVYIPSELGNFAGKKLALEDLILYSRGCDDESLNGLYCTEIKEGEKIVARGFVVDASSEYIAIFEGGKGKIISLKEKEFISTPFIKLDK